MGTPTHKCNLSSFPGNGIIEFPEFVDLMSRRPWGQLGSHDDLRESMDNAFDHDKNGYLNVSLVHLMTMYLVGLPYRYNTYISMVAATNFVYFRLRFSKF